MAQAGSQGKTRSANRMLGADLAIDQRHPFATIKSHLASIPRKMAGPHQTECRPLTYERYSSLALNNIVPVLGEVILSKLQPIQISGAYAEAVTKGRRDGKGGLSPRTVHHM